MSFFRVIVNLFHFNRTNWKAVTLCFVAALVFWFFNALNKNYSTNVKLGVNFQFDEERYIPVTPLPQEVYLNVSGNGWDLLRKGLGFNMPDMNIPLERPTEVRKIVGSTLPALLAGQLGSIQINHVVTDTLYLAIDPRESKKVKVTVDPNQFTYADGFGRLSPIVVLPDSITLIGPKRLLSQLSHSLPLEINAENLSNDFRREIDVPSPNENLITRTPQTVEVIFEVVEWIEVNRLIKLNIENTPARVRLNLMKDSINCIFQIPKGQVEDFDQLAANLLASIDLRGIGRGDRRIKPKVTGLPANTKLLHVDSVSIRLY